MTSSNASALARRKSRHELRLEQIAIWGDAAAAHGRGASDRVVTRRNAAKLNAEALDLDVLNSGFSGEADIRSGSLSMCHSRSADVFRRSGKHGAVARASMKGFGESAASGGASASGGKKDKGERGREREGDSLHGKRGGVFSKGRDGAPGFKVEINPDGPGLINRRLSERRRKDDNPTGLLKTRRQSLQMRERDENDFRLSNAKLPERIDQPGSSALDWAKFRRGRASAPILGRYRRSGSSQLPALRPPKSRRPGQKAG